MSKRVYRSILFTVAIILTLVICFHFLIEIYLPSNLKLFVGEQQEFGYNMPFKAEISGPIRGVLQVNSKPVPEDKISINLQENFSLYSDSPGKYNVDLKIFGLIPIKNVQLEVINKKSYIPVGKMIGVTVETDGVLVLGTGSFINTDGKKETPSSGKLYSGDYIQKVNNIEVTSKEQLMSAICESKGKSLNLEIRRNDEVINVDVVPQMASVDHLYKLGIWVRDDTQGIGTLTYINVDNSSFGALGHGITDIDTKQLMELSGGTIVTSLITNIIKGEDGTPGEISGIIVESTDNTIANINKNCVNGIFGGLTNKGLDYFSTEECMPIGLKYDIHLGEATIKSDISGTMEDYEIEIEKIFLNDEANKGMIIKVVDPNLLEITNGIIQGMSGSPIIQDGKLIGAVTHVFVQDSTKGYGTFIENMILEDN